MAIYNSQANVDEMNVNQISSPSISAPLQQSISSSSSSFSSQYNLNKIDTFLSIHYNEQIIKGINSSHVEYCTC